MIGGWRHVDGIKRVRADAGAHLRAFMGAAHLFKLPPTRLSGWIVGIQKNHVGRMPAAPADALEVERRGVFRWPRGNNVEVAHPRGMEGRILELERSGVGGRRRPKQL